MHVLLHAIEEFQTVYFVLYMLYINILYTRFVFVNILSVGMGGCLNPPLKYTFTNGCPYEMKLIYPTSSEISKIGPRVCEP